MLVAFAFTFESGDTWEVPLIFRDSVHRIGSPIQGGTMRSERTENVPSVSEFVSEFPSCERTRVPRA